MAILKIGRRRRSKVLFAATAASFGTCLLSGVHAVRATSLYWDSNGTVTGAGVTASGTWGTSDFWNSDPTGGSGGAFTPTTTSADDLTFSAGSDTTTAAIALSGNQSAAGITFAYGAYSFTSNTILLGGDGLTINSTSGNISLTSGIQLTAAETWTNNSSSSFSMSSLGLSVASGIATPSLTIAGGAWSPRGGLADSASGGAFTLNITNGSYWSYNNTGNNTYSGGTNIESGTIRVSQTANGIGSGLLTLGAMTGSPTAEYNPVNAGTVANAITVEPNGTSIISIGGSGNTQTYTNTLTLDNSTPLTLTTSVGTSGSAPTFDFTGQITGTGGLVMSKTTSDLNNLNVIINQSNNFSGGTTVNYGLLTLSNTAALGAAGAALNISGATVDLATDTTVNAYNTTITGTTTIKSDRYTSGAGITQTLGTLTIGSNTLNITAGSNVSGGTPLVAFGATTLSSTATGTTTLVPTTAGLTLTTVTGSATSTHTNTLALNGSSTTSAITDVIGNGSGGGNVAVTAGGTGMWTLSGANTYSGPTTISSGELAVDGTSSGRLAGTASVTITPTASANTTFKLISVTGTAGSAVDLINDNAAIVISPNNGSNKGILDMDYNPGVFDQVYSFKVNNVLQDAGLYGSSSFFTAIGMSSLTAEQSADETYFADSGGISVSVPEPTSIGLIGLAALLLKRRRRVRVQSV